VQQEGLHAVEAPAPQPLELQGGGRFGQPAVDRLTGLIEGLQIERGHLLRREIGNDVVRCGVLAVEAQHQPGQPLQRPQQALQRRQHVGAAPRGMGVARVQEHGQPLIVSPAGVTAKAVVTR
jgi:hypothetical protein